MMTNFLLSIHKQEPFTWGSKSQPGLDLEEHNNVRKEYIRALQEADLRRYDRLLEFVYS